MIQSGWRWCSKCQGLAFSVGLSRPSRCPAGGSHDHSESGNYALTCDDPSAPGQSGWRWCLQCQGLAFSEGLTKPSVCPAGGGHDHSESGNYTLAFDAMLPGGQSDWRWCRKCQGLAFSLNQPSACPAGGTHDHTGSGNYSLAFVEEPEAVSTLTSGDATHHATEPSSDKAVIDAIAYWPPTNKAYFFRGSQYVRYRLSDGEEAEEKVSLRAHRWKRLGFDDRIDAAATVEPESIVYFFHDDQVAAYRISDKAEDEGAVGQPTPIVSRYPALPGKYQRKLDAVLYWPPNNRLYFFKGASYLACDPVSGAPLQPERPITEGWSGLTFDRIDAAFRGNKGKAYFFRGAKYITYSVTKDEAIGAARPWKDHWDHGKLWAMLEGDGPVSTEVPASVLAVQSRLAFWQDLDPSTYPTAKSAEAQEQRRGFANLASMQAAAMQGFTDHRHYEGRQAGPIGPIAFRAGRDIVEAIANAHGATGQKVDRVHVFGHSNGGAGLYGEHHEKQMGLYRSSFLGWRNNTQDPNEQQARVISEIPKEHLADDVVFLLHGCKMAEGGDSFARELNEFLTTGTPHLDDSAVFAHSHSAACGQNTDWIRYSRAHPEGKEGTMPATIYHQFGAAENTAADRVNRVMFDR